MPKDENGQGSLLQNSALVSRTVSTSSHRHLRSVKRKDPPTEIVSLPEVSQVTRKPSDIIKQLSSQLNMREKHLADALSQNAAAMAKQIRSKHEDADEPAIRTL